MNKTVELLGRRVVQVVNPAHTHPVHACHVCVFGNPECPTRAEEEAAFGTSCSAMDRDRKFAHYEEVQQ